MATKTEGERALADLEAGKFSFPMVDAIRDHVNKLETELQRVSTLHDGAVNQLRQQEYTILRLEAELRKVNARLYALLKANILTEIALRETKRGAVKFVEFLPVARKHAEEGSKAALAYLSTIALRETKRGAVKFVEFLPVARKHAEEGSKAALAYLSTIDLKAKFETLKAHPLTEKALAWLANFDLPAEWTKLKTHPLTKKALSELQPVLLKAKEYLPVAQKQVSTLVDKATAYIDSLHKKAA